MGQAFDASNRELSGTPFVVAPRLLIGLGGGHPRAALSVSQNGMLAYRTRVDTGSTDLEWTIVAENAWVRWVSQRNIPTRAPPDQRKLVVSRMDPQIRTRDLWLYDFGSGGFSRFTFGTADETNAVWSPDGKLIAFDAFHDGLVDIYEKEVASGSEPKLLLHTNENKYIYDWSPDGSVLLFKMGTATWGLPRGGGKLLGPYAMDTPRVSPNGKWVAYVSINPADPRSMFKVFRPRMANGRSQRWAEWSRLGGRMARIVLRQRRQSICYASQNRLGRIRAWSREAPFWDSPEKTERRARYQVADNGRRFLVNVPRESSSHIIISTNWLPKPIR